MTIAELYEEYYEYQKATYTYGTWYPRVNLIKNHALPYIGDKDVDKATSDDIDNIYDKMEDRGLMQNTIFGMQAALMSLFSYAIYTGNASVNPVKKARTIQADLRV